MPHSALAGALEISPEAMLLVQPGGTVLAANRRAIKLFRRDAEQLISRRLTVFLADDADKIDGFLRHCLRTREGISTGIRILRADAPPISCRMDGGLSAAENDASPSVWLRLSPHSDSNKSFSFLNECLAERDRAQRRLRQSEEQLRRSVDSALDAVITIDGDGVIAGWNEQAEKTFGWASSEAIGSRLAELIIPPDQRELHERGIQQFQSGGQGPLLGRRFETTGLRRDGREFPVEVSVSAFKSGGVSMFNGFLRDLTEKKRVEEQLQETQDELTRVSRLSVVSELTASIVHEINQPLAAIAANSDTCRHWLTIAPPDIAKASAAAQRLANDARRVSEIITHIRLLTNKTTFERTLIDINQIIRDVLQLAQPKLRSVGVATDVDLPHAIPIISGDRVQLQQVILNLISNGIESMMLVSDRPRILSIRARAENGIMVVIAFQDTGVGFDPAIADRIFDTFFTTKRHGTGIGLAICRSIIESHDGTISALPGTPHGAIFQVKLPAITPGLRPGVNG